DLADVGLDGATSEGDARFFPADRRLLPVRRSLSPRCSHSLLPASMLFSHPSFLFLLLPLVVLVHLLLPKRVRNAWVLLASLVFYAWGEGPMVLLLLGSIGTNYVLGRRIVRAKERGASDRGLVAIAVVFNSTLLVLYKYAAWLLDELRGVTGVTSIDGAIGSAADWAAIHLDLPLGISFFTFQTISFILDLRRGDARPPRNLLDFGVFVSLFPQLIAGPIVRYQDLADDVHERDVRRAAFAEGVRRFVFGLAKKVLIADVLSGPVATIFALEPANLTVPLAWVGILAFAIQIYFDFSAYSDMAIGIGAMMGFRLPENFNYPHISRSVTELWHRWHISLSRWFRDYLYVPMGGNRHGKLRTYFNLWFVFFFCGLWHGAAWTFVVVGVYYGTLLVIDRMGFRALLAKAPRPFQHAFTLLVVLVGWVPFRAESVGEAWYYWSAMFGFESIGSRGHPIAMHFDGHQMSMLLLGILFSIPIYPALLAWRARQTRPLLRFDLVESMGVCALMALTLVGLASQSSSPFLYFHF
ncbi:MAG: MBOAT family O-acyltransferase, partial [Planctomycetota bacterium]